VGLSIRYIIRSPFCTANHALTSVSAYLDVEKVAILKLINSNKFIRPGFIRPSLENYTNLLHGLDVYIVQNLIFSLCLGHRFTVTRLNLSLDSHDVQRPAVTACFRLPGDSHIRARLPLYPSAFRS